MNRIRRAERMLTEKIGLDPAAQGRGFRKRMERYLREISGDAACDNDRPLTPEEEQKLIEASVVRETWFFRDQGPFQYLRAYLECREKLPLKEKLTVLSAPCATGEEPYSIAITLIEAGLRPDDFKIDAIDISAVALEIARRGVYEKGSFRNPESELRARYFYSEGGRFHLIDSIRNSVCFQSDNLLRPDPAITLPEYEVIFCRNLLIYLHESAREDLFARIDRLLRPGGRIVTGHTEVLFWRQHGYIPVSYPRSFTLIKPLQGGDAGRKSPEGKGFPMKPGGVAPPAAPEAHGAREKKIGAPIPKPERERDAAAHQHGAISGEKEASRPFLAVPMDEIEPAEDLLNRARSSADSGDLAGAMDACQAYLNRCRPDAEVYCLMGLISEAAHRPEEAENFYMRALYLDPGHHETLIHAALLYDSRREKEKAELFRKRAERARQA